MSSDDVIDLTKDLKDLLPQVVINEWLPRDDKSIFSLFQQFDRYPPPPSQYILPTNFQTVLHQDPIENFNCGSLITISPPEDTSILEAYQSAIEKSKYPILSITLQPQYGNVMKLPSWIFHYWVEIMHAIHIRDQWKTAFTWVQQFSTIPPAVEVCNSLLSGLSSVPWSHAAGHSYGITSLLASYSRKSYLSSYHIDHMIGRVKAEDEAKLKPDQTSRYIFVTVDQMRAIINFYGHAHTKKEGHLWEALMEIENKIVSGKVDSLGGVMHLPASFHWVSVVIDFQQLQILYGDSLGEKIPQYEHQAYKKWMQHLIGRSANLPSVESLALKKLETGNQPDASSCGLFALNAIAHHYLKHPLLPSDSTILACRRMEIALDIISTMMVCVFSAILNTMTYSILQTLNGDPEVPADFSFLSTPTFFQPPPELLPSSSSEKQLPLMSSPPQHLLSPPAPSIILDDFSTYYAHYQLTDDDLDPMVTDDLITHDHSDSSIYYQSEFSVYDLADQSELSAHDYTDHSGSGISAYLPPSSGAPSEVSSDVASESDLPPPQLPAASKSSSKPKQQTGLQDFFPTMPADEVHAAWSERKRKNREKDEENRAEVEYKEGKWKERKLTIQRERNLISQRKHRKKVREGEIRSGIRDKDGKKVQVNHMIIW